MPNSPFSGYRHPQEDLAAVRDIQRTPDAVERRGQAQKELPATLVHDPGNPLYAIGAYLEVLTQEEYGPLTAA